VEFKETVKFKIMKVFKDKVTKNIPAELWEGFDMMLPEDFDQPKRIRLSPWERFRMALYIWEAEQTSSTKRYLAGSSPECVIRQYNRVMECRYVVKYVDEPDSDNAKHAIVPNRIGRLCPTILDDYVNWQ
jgi:hypothetical protein